MSLRPIPEGVLLMTCEFFQSSACGRVPPIGRLPRLDPPTPGPKPGRLEPGSFGLSPSPERALRSIFSRVLFSSGRGKALPQFKQRWERAGFSTPHVGHFITEGWPSHGQLGDYPARLRERQGVSCESALSWSLQRKHTCCSSNRRKSQPPVPLGSDFPAPIVSPASSLVAGLDWAFCANSPDLRLQEIDSYLIKV